MSIHATPIRPPSQPTGAILREYLRRERIEKAPTSTALAVPKGPVFVSFPLPVDHQIESPSLTIVNPDADTTDLVAEALEHFRRAYPNVTPEIVLGTAIRYLEAWIHGPRLAYVYELGEYDVMIRARAVGPSDGSWLC